MQWQERVSQLYHEALLAFSSLYNFPGAASSPLGLVTSSRQNPQFFSSLMSANIYIVESPMMTNKSALSFILRSSTSSQIEPQDPPRSHLYRQLNSATTQNRARLPPAAALGNPRSSDPIFRVLNKGSKFCIVDGCMRRSKLNKLCWRHGGSIKCKVVHCSNRAKSRGVCWSHGGGSTCSFGGCETILVSNGFCWAHGGGKRCIVDTCSKPACERTQNLCTTHFKEASADAHVIISV